MAIQVNIIQINEVRANELVDDLKGKKYEKVRDAAQAIYKDAVEIIKHEVRNKPIGGLPTSVVIDLSDACADEHLQHKLPVLISLVKAYRAMTEITWFKCYQKRKIYKDTKDKICTTAAKLEALLSDVKVDDDNIFSPAGVRYEVSCLIQSAKCLSTTEGEWDRLLNSTANAIDARQSFGTLFISLLEIVKIAKSAFVSMWYIEVFPLEWLATDMTSEADFKKEIEPRVKEFFKKGNEYTLALVKIMTIIFQNPESSTGLKNLVFRYLVQLVAIKPDNSFLEALKVDQVFENIVKHPDRYAETRSFAAWALLEIASKPENRSYCGQIKITMEEWHKKVKNTKRYLQEKEEAKKRVEMFNTENKDLAIKLEEIKNKLQSIEEGSYKAGVSTKEFSEEDLKKEFINIKVKQKKLAANLETCNQEIAWADAQAKIDDQESKLLEQILKRLGSY